MVVIRVVVRRVAEVPVEVTVAEVPVVVRAIRRMRAEKKKQGKESDGDEKRRWQ